MASGEEIQVLGGHFGAVTGVAFSPDGQSLVSGSEDGSLRLWRYNPDQARFIPGAILIGSSQAVTSVAFSPKGDRVAGGCADGLVRIWEVEP